ncbi:hypothetical protein H4S14_001450 [Agrobacterium vitis]|nr:hypothetical protein [Agrobacterium vitis]MBE1437712.1 hypothetical protein [Agrobacterium vitis]
MTGMYICIFELTMIDEVKQKHDDSVEHQESCKNNRT